MTSGAYTLASRAPNWLRRAGVATTRSDPSGSDADVPSASSLPAPTPPACSAAHMAGSQATIALGLTWPAIHRAALARAAVAASSETEIGPLPELTRAGGAAGEAVVPTTTAVTAAETASTAHPTSASRRQPVTLRAATGCRPTHSRIVVAMTVGHDGSGRGAPVCDHALLSAISAPQPCHQAGCGLDAMTAH